MEPTVGKHDLDDAELKWWLAWQNSDYSWTGLASKSIDKTDATLLDVWIQFEDDLIELPNGKSYTPAHLPFYTIVEEEGHLKAIPTEKHTWDENRWAELEFRLRSLPGYYSRPGADDHIIKHQMTAKIDGCCLRTMPPKHYNEILDAFIEQSFEVAGRILFRRCFFGSTINVNEKKFDSLIFDRCEIQDIFVLNSKISTLSFANCNVGKILVKYCSIEDFMLIRSNVNNIRESTLFGSEFKKSLDMEGTHHKCIVLLNGIILEGRLFLYISDFTISDFEKQVVKPILVKSGGNLEDVWYQLAALEDGSRVAKNYMKSVNDEESANIFHVFELWARTENPYTSWSTVWALHLYRLFSCYGTDITRPLLWLFGLPFAIALIYMLLYTAHMGWTLKPSLAAYQYYFEALAYAYSRITPFVPWDAGEAAKVSGLHYTLKTGFSPMTALAQIIALLQTLGSGVLLFLSALAARRRFKMSD